MKTYKQFVSEGKKDYEIYHKLYSDAVGEAINLANKQGFDVDEEDIFQYITTGPRKPSRGKTNRFKISLTKNGKPVRKMLIFQIYGMDNSSRSDNNYELTAYVS